MIRIVTAGMLALVAVVHAQEAPMRPFDLWVGRWKGAGWATSATGQRTEFSLVETVERKAGGTVLVVEGRGQTLAADGQERVTHDGLAVISYDAKAGRYRWNGHDRLAGSVDTDITLVDGGFAWAIPAGGATVRFTIRFDATQWREVGEVTTDGRTWNTFMEMSLRRQ